MKDVAPDPGALIVRRHTADGVLSEATYSPGGFYRYALTRTWDKAAPRVAFVMLNPSTATERADDPTILRCRRRSEAAGFGSVRIVNLFALRQTRPADLLAASNPVGEANDATLRDAARWADAILAAWGAHGAHMGRAGEIEEMLRNAERPLFHLGLTRKGQPRHPLYVAYSAPFLPWAGGSTAGNPLAG